MVDDVLDLFCEFDIGDLVRLTEDHQLFVGYGLVTDIKNSFDLTTADSCFIVINTTIKNINFDESIFDDFHLYVEDLCIQIGKGKTVLCNYIEPEEFQSIDTVKKLGWIHHGGNTYNKLGSSWGRYSEYKEKLNILNLDFSYT